MIRALLALLFLIAFLACATPDPRIDAMQAELQALKAEKAKPVEPPPKPTIKTQLVKIAGVSLPKNCGFLERSDINVRAPAYAALLVCQEKPPGVEAIVAKPPAHQAPAKAK